MTKKEIQLFNELKKCLHKAINSQAYAEYINENISREQSSQEHLQFGEYLQDDAQAQDLFFEEFTQEIILNNTVINYLNEQ